MRILIGLIIAACVAFSLAPAANAEPAEWYYIDTDHNGTKVYAYGQDLAAGRPTSKAARLWVKMDSRNDNTVPFNEMKTMYVVDCTVSTYRIVTVQVYYPNGRTQTVQGDNKISFIVPDSVIAEMAKILCAPSTWPTGSQTNHSSYTS